MAVPADWIEHRRGDGELLGWMYPESDGFVVVDLLGRTLVDPVDWLSGEATLESAGIGYLADPYELLVDDRWVRVRIVEVSQDAIRVKGEDWGAIDFQAAQYTLPFPVPKELRPLASS